MIYELLFLNSYLLVVADYKNISYGYHWMVYTNHHNEICMYQDNIFNDRCKRIISYYSFNNYVLDGVDLLPPLLSDKIPIAFNAIVKRGRVVKLNSVWQGEYIIRHK